MKYKKMIMFISIIVIIGCIIYIGYYLINNSINNKKIKEFIPPEEISQEQLRKTNILLYFSDKNTGELTPEIRQIDSKELLESPEELIMELLLKGPNDKENYDQLIPQGVQLLGTEIKEGILYINFSDEFSEINNNDDNKKQIIINSIIKTVSQLNEINKIIIQINGNILYIN